MTNTLNFTVKAEKQDFDQYKIETWRELNLLNIMVAGLAAGYLAAYTRSRDIIGFMDWFIILIPFLVVSIIGITYRLKFSKRINLSKDGLFYKPLHFALSEQTVKIWNDIDTIHCTWKETTEITEDRHLIYIWLDNLTAKTIPKRQIDNPKILYAQLQNWFIRSQENQP